MTQVIRMAGAIITLNDVYFNCPKCNHPYTEDDYYPQIQKSKYGLIYKKCKGCSEKIGITHCMTGDVKVWMKAEEPPKDYNPSF